MQIFFTFFMKIILFRYIALLFNYFFLKMAWIFLFTFKKNLAGADIYCQATNSFCLDFSCCFFAKSACLSCKSLGKVFTTFHHIFDNGNLGKFTGKKITLLDFIKEYTKFSFEVVEESYGYNSVVYNGYLILPGKDNFIELTLTIYHFGNIIYETNQ